MADSRKCAVQLSGERIITMEWMDGCKLTDLEGLRDQHLHSRDVAIELLKAFAKMTFVDGFGMSHHLLTMPLCPVCLLPLRRCCAAKECCVIIIVPHLGRPMRTLSTGVCKWCASVIVLKSLGEVADLCLCFQFMATLMLATFWSDHTQSPRVRAFCAPHP